jgi:predicted amidohydrolase YtcJ
VSDPVLFYNGVIHTLDPVRPHCTWFTVLGKSIQRIGDGQAPQTKTTIDLKSKVVVPGFVDAHTHFFQTGLDKLFCDFSSVKNSDDVHALVSKSELGKRTWIFAHSYDEENLSDGSPPTVLPIYLSMG